MSAQKWYVRFSLAQRLEHWVMVISFTILAITGLPQKFAFADISDRIIALLGGIEAVRVIHRYAAIVLIVGTIIHFAEIVYKAFIKRVNWTMFPNLQDGKDLVGVIAYNLGIRKTHPKLPRYNFEEKMEYWSLIWGTVLMIITGFMLWNPIASAKLLPGSFVPAAKAAHGGEAVLAVLAIIVWHMYGVHLRRFNTSMFTGKLSRTAMEHDHAMELEAIEQGETDAGIDTETLKKRTRVFIPIAAIIVMTLLFGLYFFVTFEDTAIATVDEIPANTTEAYQPIMLADGNIHATLENYSDASSCSAAGCHDSETVKSASNAAHNQMIMAKGPNPLLASIVDAKSANGQADCLVCHAQDYHPDDALASAKTVRPAGGETCQRCHSGHPAEDVHTTAGLACVSCHTSSEHQIQAQVDCTTCHRENPHTNPQLSTYHDQLDCRACHITGNTIALTLDTENASKDSLTGWYMPNMEVSGGTASFGWVDTEDNPATIDTPNAKIVPIIPATILAPANFDALSFAESGKISSSPIEYPTQIVLGHGITKDNARTCGDCHGPDADFDFNSLNYGEQADSLSLVQPETE